MYIIKEMTVRAYPQVIVGSHQLKCGGEQLSNSCDFLQVVCRPENFITKEEPYLESKKKKPQHKRTYLQSRNKATDIENKLMVTKKKRQGRDKLEDWD